MLLMLWIGRRPPLKNSLNNLISPLTTLTFVIPTTSVRLPSSMLILNLLRQREHLMLLSLQRHLRQQKLSKPQNPLKQRSLLKHLWLLKRLNWLNCPSSPLLIRRSSHQNRNLRLTPQIFLILTLMKIGDDNDCDDVDDCD